MATRKKAKKLVSARFDERMIEALDELSLGSGEIIIDDLELAKKTTRTAWVEICVNLVLSMALRNEISGKQVKGYASSPELFRLFTMYSRARRGVEGYGFTTKDKDTRFVYGPPPGMKEI